MSAHRTVGGVAVLCIGLLLWQAAQPAPTRAADLAPASVGLDARGAIESHYNSLGGAAGILGAATDEMHVVVVVGAAQTFAGGSIYWSPTTGAHAVYGGIADRYRALGGPDSPWGLPTSDEADAEVAGARSVSFAGGVIVWSPTTGAHGVRGPVLDRWSALGGPEGSAMGLPTGSTEAVGEGLRGFFQRGEIHWSPATGAWWVLGGNLEEFGRLGGPQGGGFPLDEETPVPGGVAQVFERSRIYWSESAGSHAIYGGVLSRYLSLGGPGSALGLPVTGEVEVPRGRQETFQNGQIVWSATHGAKALVGDIHRRYADLAGPWSFLGLPTSEEFDVGEDRQMDFTGGAIRWIRRTGAIEVISPFRAVAHPVTAQELPYSYRSGCPVEPVSLRRLEVTYLDFAGAPQIGNLIVHQNATAALIRVFEKAFAAGFPIQQMNSVDAFRGNDVASMAAGNTSAFNCRKVVGNPYRISQHSYGNAIDINPAQNPYVAGGVVYPAGSRSYLDRRNRRQGMHTSGTAVLEAMRAERWAWGARWSEPDYHHFSANGG